MIEQYLQFATKFIKEKWLQLNAMFQLEETQTFKFLKPYLLQAQDNPAYIGIAIALMAILYSLYKFISISRKRIGILLWNSSIFVGLFMTKKSRTSSRKIPSSEGSSNF